MPEAGSCPRTEQGRDPRYLSVGPPPKRGMWLWVYSDGTEPWRDLPYLDPELQGPLWGPQSPAQTPPPPWVPGPPWDVDAPRTLAGFTYKKWGEIQLCSPSSTWRIPRAGKDPGTIRQRQAGRMRPPAKPGGLFAPSLLAF